MGLSVDADNVGAKHGREAGRQSRDTLNGVPSAETPGRPPTPPPRPPDLSAPAAHRGDPAEAPSDEERQATERMGLSPPQTIAEVAEQRRCQNARTLTLTIFVLTVPAVLSIWATTETDAVFLQVVLLSTIPATAIAHWLTRRGRMIGGVLTMLAGLLVEHCALAANPHAFVVTPFFSSLIVLIAATALPSRWLGRVAVASFLAVLIQGAIGAARYEGALPGSLPAAVILLAFTTVLAFLHVHSVERAFSVAEELEQRRQELSARLEKSERMEALGRLASGVAHDFNNFLVVIQGSAELAAHELPADHECQGELQRIEEAATRATELTSQLLTFSRRELNRPRLLDPIEVARGLERILQGLVGEGIDLKLALVSEGAQLRAVPTQIERILLNLISNARDAMPDGGTVSVSIQSCSVPASMSGPPAGSYVEISVRDEGIGMTREVREHIFEPFYTTKDKARGTGLGLATTFGIIKQLHGHIFVDSAPGRGSTFRVYLPVACS